MVIDVAKIHGKKVDQNEPWVCDTNLLTEPVTLCVETKRDCQTRISHQDGSLSKPSITTITTLR